MMHNKEIVSKEVVREQTNDPIHIVDLYLTTYDMENYQTTPARQGMYCYGKRIISWLTICYTTLKPYQVVKAQYFDW